MTGGKTEDDRAGPDTPDQRYRRLLDHSPDAICVHQMGRLVYLNAAGVRWMAAASADQLVGGPITRFVHPDSIPAMLTRIAALNDEGDVSEPSEAVMLRFDGTTLDVEAVSVRTVWNGEPAFQVIFRDITAQKAAQAALRYQAALVDHVSDAIIGTTAAGLVSSWNPAAETIYRRSASRVFGLSVSEAVGAELDPQKIIAAGGIVNATHYTRQGSALAIRVSATAMDDGFVLLCSDQTALRRAERHFETVVAALDEAVVILHHSGRVLSVNPAVRRVLGTLAHDDEIVDYDWLVRHWDANGPFVLHDADGRPLDPGARPVLRTLHTGIPFSGEVFSVSRDGMRKWVAVSSRRLNPDEGDRSAMLLWFRDVTPERSAAERLAHQATHDPLTGLPNRAHLVDTVGRLHADGTLAALVFIDLDDLKGVNDALGHDAGDDAIQAAAQRLQSVVRRDDIVCRLAGDEFVVLLVGQFERVELDRLAQRINARLAEPMDIGGSATIQMGASVGVVETVPGDPRDAGALLRAADQAMYAAKARGGRTVVFSTDVADGTVDPFGSG